MVELHLHQTNCKLERKNVENRDGDMFWQETQIIQTGKCLKVLFYPPEKQGTSLNLCSIYNLIFKLIQI